MNDIYSVPRDTSRWLKNFIVFHLIDETGVVFKKIYYIYGIQASCVFRVDESNH